MQNNILFDKPLDKNKYNDIIDACALATDLEILPGGDQTEIGEKGTVVDHLSWLFLRSRVVLRFHL